jgi:predicted  nucleic acid-binding Zn-ribbon protein
MKFFALLVACAAVSPIEKTIELLESLQAKIVKEGEEEAKLYEEFTSFCNDESKETQFEIKTAKADVERAEAAIADETAKIGVAETKIEELSTSIATAEKDLASATTIREKENADFVKLEKELMEAVSMLERAIAIIEREMAKTGFIQGGAAMKKISDALEGVVTAAGVNTADRAKITALLQAQSGDEDLALELQPGGAPDPAAYKSKSGGIVSVLEDMLEKAKGELAAAQKAEMNAKFDYDMLKQKLEDMMANGNKVMDETKKAKAAAEEAKAIAQGELDTASKTLADSESHLKDLQQECMSKAEEYETSQHSRSEELTALDTAKKVLLEKTAGAAEREYSFIQVSAKTRVGARAKQAKDEVLNLIQGLAKDDKAMSLLAQRVESASMLGADPFAKIKGLIQEMIEKLEEEAAKEAAHKAFCDKEMSETKAKKEDKESEIEDLTTKIDKATAKIAKLTEEIATLEEELGAIAKAQKEADAIRTEEKAAWEAAKADYESGIEGVGMALKVLRDYYAEKEEALIQAKHDKATGAASGIIGMLEVVESDFTKSLAEGTAKEAMAVEEYEKLTQDNKIATTEKTTAAKYKNKDKKETEEYLVSLKEDKVTLDKEYAAVMEYWNELQPMCIAKPEPYAERKKRREAEIAGLKEALTILEEEAGSAFLQIRTARRV